MLLFCLLFCATPYFDDILWIEVVHLNALKVFCFCFGRIHVFDLHVDGSLFTPEINLYNLDTTGG